MLTAKVRARRIQSVPGCKASVMYRAAYNSRILGMLTPPASRFVRSVVFLLPLLFAVPAIAQNWAGAEEQLAGKIASAIGQQAMVQKTVALEVLNRSSLGAATADDIRRNLLTQLAALGVRFAGAGEAAAMVRVSLSEDLQNYIWIAEIRSNANTPSVVMISLPRPAILEVEPVAAAMALKSIPLWSQSERILDVAVIDGNPTWMLVLDANGVAFYRLQDGRWQLEQSSPIVHPGPWPRDLRGRLVLRREKGHLFDAYLPGVLCRSSDASPRVVTCSDSDTAWPVGTEIFSLNATFTSSRNFFSGALSPSVGRQATAPAFYSAAPVPREQTTWWLLATVDGQIHLFDGNTDQVVEKLGWGSDIVSLHSGCGSGWQVLATGSGAGKIDTVRAFEVTGREPIAASAALDMNGTISALWTESGGGSAVAVVHNSETGSYEAFRLTVTCGH
jgi:hypothetical protein